MMETGEIFRGLHIPESYDAFPSGIVDGGIIPAAFQMLFSSGPITASDPVPEPEETKTRNIEDLNKLEMRPWTMPARIPSFVQYATERMCTLHSGTTLAYVGMKDVLESSALNLNQAQQKLVWEMLTAVDNRFTKEQITQLFECLKPAMTQINWDAPDPHVDELAHVIGVYLFRPVRADLSSRNTAHILKYLYVAYVHQLAKLHRQYKNGFSDSRKLLPNEVRVFRSTLSWMPLVFLIPIPMLDIYAVHHPPSLHKLAVADKNESDPCRVYFAKPPVKKYFTRVLWAAFSRAWKESVLFSTPFETKRRPIIKQEVAAAYGIEEDQDPPKKRPKTTPPPLPYPMMWPPMMFGPPLQ